MKKYVVNDNEINFFIDYVRIPKKNNKDYSNTTYDYNCDLNIVVDKPLTDYEKECLCRLIKQLVNNYDRYLKMYKDLIRESLNILE